MNRFSFRHALVAVAITVVAVSGCQKKPGNTGAAGAPTTSAPSKPEESFAIVVETFRRGVEDVPIGFVVRDDSGSQTMMTGRNEVTHELIPPAKDGDLLKAIITVTSQSRYSLQRTTEDAKKADQAAADADSAADEDSDVQVFDPDVVSAPGGTGPGRSTGPKIDKNAVTVARSENEHERKYELVYENGRWKLVTKLDPKTEESIKFAFARALESQG